MPACIMVHVLCTCNIFMHVYNSSLEINERLFMNIVEKKIDQEQLRMY